MVSIARKQRLHSNSKEGKPRGKGSPQQPRECVLGDRVVIKFVTKARKWCKTTIKDGEQKLEWFSEKPEEN